MTKDERIAELEAACEQLRERCRELRADNQRLLDVIQQALDREPPVITRTAGAIRQQRYREKQQASLSVTEPSPRYVTQASQSDVTRNAGGLIGGLRSPDLPGETDWGRRESYPEEERQGKGSGENPKRHVVTVGDADPDWLAFRETYPKTHRTSWAVAERRFLGLNQHDRAAALRGAAKYAAQCPGEFTKGAQSWLLERRWETVDDAPSTNGHRATEDYHPTKVVV